MRIDDDVNPQLSMSELQSTCGDCGQDFATTGFQLRERGPVLTPKICPECARTREAKMREEIDKAEADRLEARWSALCPPEFRLTSETEGATSIAQLELRQSRLSEVLAWQSGATGLLLIGPSGSGKTRCMFRLLRRLFVEGMTIRVLSAVGFDRACRDAGGQYRLTEWFNSLANADAFFLDDLGKARMSEGSESQLFDLVDERTKYQRPIFLTTNLSGPELAEGMTQNRAAPLVRRIRQYCQVIEMK